MSWEHDKGFIIFLLVMGLFVLFCSIMAIRSAKKQKAKGVLGQHKEEEKQDYNNSMFGYGFIIFLAFIWLASAVLIMVLYQTNNLGSSFTIPRIMSLPYELFGITGGAMVQIIVCIGIIIGNIRSIMKVKRNKSKY